MSTLIFTTSILTLLLAGMAYIAIWSRRPSNARLLSILVLIPLAALSFTSVFANLGHPTICWSGVTTPVGKLKVLGYKVVKDVSITIMLDGPDGPRMCQMPYSQGSAEGLQEGSQSGQGSTAGDAKGGGFEGFFDGPKPLTVHPTPVQPPAPKDDNTITIEG